MLCHSRILGELIVHQIGEILKGLMIMKKRIHIDHQSRDHKAHADYCRNKDHHRPFKRIIYFFMLFSLHLHSHAPKRRHASQVVYFY